MRGMARLVFLAVLFTGGIAQGQSPTGSMILAEGFATVGIGIGYRTPRWEIRVDGRNLADRRDPVSESEIGDAQYYLMPSRRVEASFAVRF